MMSSAYLSKEMASRLNNGVYRAGFATTQAAYEEAYDQLFSMLDALELRLKDRTLLLGEQITEADWRLFTTLIRFDAVYHAIERASPISQSCGIIRERSNGLMTG